MRADQEILFDLGPLGDTIIGHDIYSPVHLRYTVDLDHVIDDKLIKQAWDTTKRVYPIIDALLMLVHDKSYYMARQEDQNDPCFREHVYLVKATDGSNDPVKSKVPIRPETDIVGNRVVCISYFDKTVSISCYHTLLDGTGMSMVFRTFLYEYLALYTGHRDEHPIVELEEGRSLEQYYMSARELIMESLDDYTPQPLYMLPFDTTGFIDKDMRNEMGPHGPEVSFGSIRVPSKDFMSLCKRNGANPSAMLCTLLAKALYELNPDEERDAVFELTISTRKLFGCERSISNHVSTAMAYTSRKDIETGSLADASRKIRADISSQRGRDYEISLKRTNNMYRCDKRFANLVVTYIGTFSIGDNDEHIKDFRMGTFANTNLYCMGVGDEFILMLQYGVGTQKYLDAFIGIFKELGIEARMNVAARTVDYDVLTPVL
ncbi:MAG: hypothetical protein Q4B54_06445 [Coriobacteriales bacterium]|nr:hypothetical protein [Coriobacteriales bacterium]